MIDIVYRHTIIDTYDIRPATATEPTATAAATAADYHRRATIEHSTAANTATNTTATIASTADASTAKHATDTAGCHRHHHPQGWGGVEGTVSWPRVEGHGFEQLA